MATFSLVASACMSTSTWSTLPRSCSRIWSISRKATRPARRNTLPLVHHGEAHAVVLGDDPAAPRLGGQVVRRAHDRMIGVQVRVDLTAMECVVAQRDDVRARGEQLVGDLWRDAEAARGVLAVDDHEGRLVV